MLPRGCSPAGSRMTPISSELPRNREIIAGHAGADPPGGTHYRAAKRVGMDRIASERQLRYSPTTFPPAPVDQREPGDGREAAKNCQRQDTDFPSHEGSKQFSKPVSLVNFAGSGRESIAFVIIIADRNGVRTTKPAAEINIGTTFRAERLIFRVLRLVADCAIPLGARAAVVVRRIGHSGLLRDD